MYFSLLSLINGDSESTFKVHVSVASENCKGIFKTVYVCMRRGGGGGGRGINLG